MIQIYNSQNIDTLPWPTKEESLRTKGFCVPLIKNGVDFYIENIRTEMQILLVDNHLLPLTINDGEYDNSYVCSPYGQYIGYAKDSLGMIKNSILRKAAKVFLEGQGKLFRCGNLNKAVIVNNWLGSTNLYPKIEEEQLHRITHFLKERFTQHAIIFRSIDAFSNPNCMQYLKKQGFHLIASRYIYFTNTGDETIFQTRIFKSDLRFLEKNTYNIIDESEITPHDIPRILQLYQAVYLEKHSKMHPQINLDFIKLALESKMLHIKALKKGNAIDGFVAYYCTNGMMTAPLLGYDTNQPDEGLYRLLCTILTLEAKSRKMTLHQSAGASFYKKIRRAVGALEYMAVSNDHLSLARRAPWIALKGVFNGLAVPFMKKY